MATKTRKNMDQLLEFYKEYKDQIGDNWRRVIYSDTYDTKIGKQTKMFQIIKTQEKRFYCNYLVFILKKNQVFIKVLSYFQDNKLNLYLSF